MPAAPPAGAPPSPPPPRGVSPSASLGTPPDEHPVILSAEHLFVRAGDRTLLNDISLDMNDREVTAIIGPSGCGKTTFIRSLNRMGDLSSGLTVSGSVRYRGQDIYGPKINPVQVRRRIGMVFQRPVVFPQSVYENVAFGLRLERADEDTVEAAVTSSLKRAGLWLEVKDILRQPALQLSGGQQQRLCIARALAIGPRVLLMDEPTASLDPVGTQRIEDLLFELKREYAVVIVTHNMQQAARVADRTAFFYNGRLIEVDATKKLFETPSEKLTEAYITGRFG
jgi:phosphate transport system ATP-binding protein